MRRQPKPQAAHAKSSAKTPKKGTPLLARQERAAQISEILESLFPAPKPPLCYSSPFSFLVAVMLSAQCTDERVNQVTPHLFARGNLPSDLLALSQDEVQAIIRPCGLSQRKAAALIATAERISSQHGGEVPSSWEALEALPGVGHKTASVIMSQLFHQPAFPVDTHIYRCAHRWGLTTQKSISKTEGELKDLFPKEKWGTLHLQIILFARKYCPARNHQPTLCPICQWLPHSERSL